MCCAQLLKSPGLSLWLWLANPLVWKGERGILVGKDCLVQRAELLRSHLRLWAEGRRGRRGCGGERGGPSPAVTAAPAPAWSPLSLALQPGRLKAQGLLHTSSFILQQRNSKPHISHHSPLTKDTCQGTTPVRLSSPTTHIISRKQPLLCQRKVSPKSRVSGTFQLPVNRLLTLPKGSLELIKQSVYTSLKRDILNSLKTFFLVFV